MRATMALALAIAALSLTLADRTALAQDIAPETPPELRDFRLDQQPVQPATQPAFEPAPVTPPPATATVPNSGTATPRAQTSATTPRRLPAPVAAPITVETPTGGTVDVPAVGTTDPVADDDTVSENVEPRPVPGPSSSASWLSVAAGLGLFSLMLAAIVVFRRSRNRPVQHDTIKHPAAAAVPEPSIPVGAAAKPAPLISASKPRITIDFIPEKASISFTALTIKGELRIINQSDSAAKNMQLRAALISASAQQETEISGFHGASLDTQVQSLGDAQARERIGMQIELTVPLADLQSFPLGDRRLFVPIMVGNIAYSNEAGTFVETAKIACMIGREANPPKPRMAPFRLDLGPRSFSPLGQRPLLT